MVKRKPLVSQHLENISRDALEKYQNILRQYVRRRRGIYALYRGDKLYYVGLASNLRSRLSHHLRDRHGDSWNRFSVYLTIGDTHLKELESLVLRIVRPPANRVIGKFFTSQDLRGVFAKDMRVQQQDDLRTLFGRKQRGEEKPKQDGAKNRAVLGKYISKLVKLRARFKGKLVQASVKKDGQIRYGGKTYTSPSLAAAAACKRRTCNGWTFWEYERAPGDWVRLNELRR